ncbi:hypothetical protein ACU8KH_04251 [Lachancea thermotolerans]
MLTKDIEQVKVEDFDYLTKHAYMDYSRVHTEEFLVYNGSRLNLHAIGLPIVLRCPLEKENIDELLMTLHGLTARSFYGVD